MKDKNLEKEILNKVYKFEKQRTSLVVARYLILFVGILALIIFAIVRIIAVLNNQGDLDLLQLFSEDSSIIRQYFGEVLDTFIIEFPKFLAFELIILIVLFGGVIFFIAKNFKKLKNRLSSLKKYEK